MLTSLFRKNVGYTSLRGLSSLAVYGNSVRNSVRYCLIKTKSPCSVRCRFTGNTRFYSTESDSEPKTILPPLTDQPRVYTPSMFKLAIFPLIAIAQIKLAFDEDFYIDEVAMGCAHAVTVISRALADEDYESLQGLVTEDLLNTLKDSIVKLTPAQRALLPINREDIFVCSPYDLSVDSKVVNDVDVHTIKLSMLFYSNKNFKSKSVSDVLFLKEVIVSNYEFERVYEGKVGGPWVVTSLNQFSHGKRSIF